MTVNSLSDQIHVSLFDPYKKPDGFTIPGTKSPEQLLLLDFMESIRNGRWKEEVQKVRDVMEQFDRNSEEHSEAKKCIPAVTLSVQCNSRESSLNIEDKFENYNCLLQFDGDFHEKPDEINEKKKLLANDEHFVFVSISPSGDGIKGAIAYQLPDHIKITPDNLSDVHTKAFQEIDNYLFANYGFRNDPYVKDPFRMCFATWDEDIKINENVIPFQLSFYVDQVQNQSVQKASPIYNKKLSNSLEIACGKVRTAEVGTRHDTALKQATLLGGYIAGSGLDEDTAKNALVKAINENPHVLNETERKEFEQAIIDGIKHGKTKPIQIPYTGRIEPEYDQWLRKIYDAWNLMCDFESWNFDQIKTYAKGGEKLDAELLHILFQDKVTFIPEMNAFFVFEKFWVNQKKQGSFLTDMLETLQSLYEYVNDEDDEVIVKKIRMLESRHHTSNILFFLQTFHTPIKNFDCHIELINFKNGTYDVSNRVFREHRATDYLTKMIDYDYSEQAVCPDFDEFIRLCFDNNQSVIEYMTYQMGTYITGYNPDILTVAVGKGTNGKSFLFKIIREILGPYACQSSANELFGSRQKIYINELVGKRFVVVGEMSEGQMLSGSIKEIVSRDKKQAEGKFKDPREFDAEYSIVTFTNNQPKITDNSHGMSKRLVFVSFPHQFPNSERSSEYQWEKRYLKEAPGILAKMVKSAVEWWNLEYIIPDEIRAFTQSTIDECTVQDSLAEYLQAEKDVSYLLRPNTKMVSILNSVFVDGYRAFCQQNKLEKLNRNKLSKKLQDMGYETGNKRVEGKSSCVIFGIGDVNNYGTSEFNGVVDTERSNVTSFPEMKERSEHRNQKVNQ